MGRRARPRMRIRVQELATSPNDTAGVVSPSIGLPFEGRAAKKGSAPKRKPRASAVGAAAGRGSRPKRARAGSPSRCQHTETAVVRDKEGDILSADGAGSTIVVHPRAVAGVTEQSVARLLVTRGEYGPAEAHITGARLRRLHAALLPSAATGSGCALSLRQAWDYRSWRLVRPPLLSLYLRACLG
jgi:hypothetical protein